MKKCTKCGVEKPLSEFNKNKSKKDGFGTECKPCAKQNLKKWLIKNPEKQKAIKKKWYENNKEAVYKQSRNWIKNNQESYKFHARKSLLKKYGLTPESFEEKKLAQDNKCEICKEKLDNSVHTCVDHCHSTGKTRGILCRKCNNVLGQAMDNPFILKSALNYLKKYK